MPGTSLSYFIGMRNNLYFYLCLSVHDQWSQKQEVEKFKYFETQQSEFSVLRCEINCHI